MNYRPRITLVTPSFNQAQYIEATIDSVLSQGYGNLQYIVVDGGSTDGSVQILKRYEKHFNILIIEPDEGSADAINKGLQLANGEWFNWLNSDDLLMPGALDLLAEHSSRWPQKQWISGCKVNVDASGRCVSSQAPWRENIDFWLLGEALFPQDATFIRTEHLRSNGLTLDVSLKNVYDTVLYLQLLEHSIPLLVSSVFSAMRWHPQQKTANTLQRLKESTVIQSAAKRLYDYPYLMIARRICRSRLRPVALPIFLTMSRFGLWPSRRSWYVEYFNVWEQKFELKSIGDFILA